MDAMTVDTIVHLRAGGVSVILDARGGRLPAVVHWGVEVEASDLAGLAAATVPVIGSNNVDVAPRVAVLPEPHTGWTGRPGLSGSFSGEGWSPRFTVREASLDGAALDGEVAAGAGTARFTAIDDRAWLQLVLEVRLESSGLVALRATLTNLRDAAYCLDDLTLTLPVPLEASELLDFTGRHNRERVPQRSPMRQGLHLRENRRGRTGADSAFVLHLGVPGFGFGAGPVWGVHTAWSGDHRHLAERVHTGEQLLGGGEVLLPGEIVLARGDAYASPWVHGTYGDGLDAAARRFHAHLRAGVGAPGPDRPVTLNVWEAVYFRHDAAELIELAELAAALGVERFVLDDGWFGARRHDRAGLGDWVVSPEVWPDGLHPLVDRVHELGMQFGLWFEPEMVNLDSDVARAHPEWIMAARDDLPVESRFQQVLDLAVPGAYAHVAGQLHALLDEYRIDAIKWDHNRDLVDAGDRTRGGRPAVHEQTLAFYRLVDELRERHPGLEIESCSSGGARVDLGVAERTQRVWVSDNSDPFDRQLMLRWTAQLLPPEYLGAHIAAPHSHTTGRWSSLGFRAATAVFGHFGIEWNLRDADEAARADLARWIAFYTEHRALLHTGDVVRLDTPDPDVIAHGVVAADGSTAIFSTAVLDSIHPDPPAPLRLRGLIPGARYHVEPLLIGETPSGLHAPTWWGAPSDAEALAAQEYWDRAARIDVTHPGAVFDTDVLEQVGVASPRLNPGTVVLYRLRRA